MWRPPGLRIVLAAALSASFAATPSLAKVGAKCSGFAGLTCGPDEFCQRPPGVCSLADAEASCVRKPTICSRIYLPVCGCDARTYGNDCERMAAGVSLAHAGKCAGTP